jgi:hypothetical protein
MPRNRNTEDTIVDEGSDVEVNLDDEAAVEQAIANDSESGINVAQVATYAGQSGPKQPQKKHPLPEGYVTPVEFAHVVERDQGWAVGSLRPQIIYGYIKNNKGFGELVTKHTDGRNMMKSDDALVAYKEMRAKTAEREANKAAKGNTPAPAGSQPTDDASQGAATTAQTDSVQATEADKLT